MHNSIIIPIFASTNKTKTNFIMKANVIYLKDTGVDTYYAFDFTNFTMVEAYAGEFVFHKFDNEQDIKSSYPIYSDGCEPITRQEFIDFYKSQSEMLNNIIKEL